MFIFLPNCRKNAKDCKERVDNPHHAEAEAVKKALVSSLVTKTQLSEKEVPPWSVKILLFLEVNTAQVLVLYDEFFKQNKNGEISKEKFLEERQVFILASLNEF